MARLARSLHADAVAGLASGRCSGGADFPGIHRRSILPAVVGPHGYRPASDSCSTTASLESLDTTPGATPIDDQYLRTADITGINWEPSADDASPEVQVHMKSPQPLVVQGTPANNDVKRVLLYVLHNNQRFAPDVRIN